MTAASAAKTLPPATHLAANELELSIVMPCLNEAETLATCIRKAQAFLARSGVGGEVLVADNGSTDGSQDLALAEGARVVQVPEKGYGAALSGGIRAARGRYVIMADADDSYDFLNLEPFVAELRAGADLVMGNRFAGGISPGAMPSLHRYLGNPVLSFVGRILFRAPVGDFHCGLRGFRRSSVEQLALQTTGMEFASEMVVKASLFGQKVVEVPATLSPDGRSRAPHLRSWRDGWRHLRFLLLMSPRWLFVIPGLTLLALGLLATASLTAGPLTLAGATFDVTALLYAAAAVLIGHQATLFGVFTKVYAIERGFLPRDRRLDALARRFRLESGLVAGALLLACGAAAAGASLWRWRSAGFGELDPGQQLRVAAPAVIGLVLGVTTILASLFLSILGLDYRIPLGARPAPTPARPPRPGALEDDGPVGAAEAPAVSARG
ncbi:MAG: glycosyltransferase family 2 protein [Acidimicrobiales bacterium]